DYYCGTWDSSLTYIF
nr:immunoglobulin light chain junction region [Macaca mulatta]